MHIMKQAATTKMIRFEYGTTDDQDDKLNVVILHDLGGVNQNI